MQLKCSSTDANFCFLSRSLVLSLALPLAFSLAFASHLLLSVGSRASGPPHCNTRT